MGLKKAFDDAEKRGETRCSVCLSTVHSKEYHENAAQSRQGQAEVSALTEEQRHLAVSALRHYRTACSQSGTAFADNIDSTIVALLATAPEQADQLVERWEQIAEHGEGTPATDNFYFRCAMERCAAELKATLRATAPLEQAALYHCTYCDGNHNEKDCPQRCVPDQPQSASGEYWTNERLQSVAKNMACSGGDIQAASGGALSAENIKLKIGSRFYDREPYSGAWDEPFNVACEVLNAALAAHDQKVRREVLEAINDVVRESAIYRPEGRSWITGPEEVLAAIRVALASVEKEK